MMTILVRPSANTMRTTAKLHGEVRRLLTTKATRYARVFELVRSKLFKGILSVLVVVGQDARCPLYLAIVVATGTSMKEDEICIKYLLVAQFSMGMNIKK